MPLTKAMYEGLLQLHPLPFLMTILAFHTSTLLKEMQPPSKL